jgi:UDPglucose--hexose-1-phosphate uridylyltransferase
VFDRGTVLDALTGEVTFVSQERMHRPDEYREGAAERCAFCPGNENETPPEVASYRNAAGAWLVRAFGNKYPTVRPPQGDHEVIVDSRDHLGEVTSLGVRMWHERYSAALARMPDATPVLFKNSGAYAGATIVHPHTQLLVLRSEIPRWREMRMRAALHRAASGRCVWCDEIARAQQDETLVWEDGAYVAYTRAEARFAGALTIVPRACDASWLSLLPEDLQAFAIHLVRAADVLRESGTAFNITLVAEPHVARGAFHWHVEVIPRLSTLAGFELSTGMFVKSGTAQESAQQWRRTLAVLNGPV